MAALTFKQGEPQAGDHIVFRLADVRGEGALLTWNDEVLRVLMSTGGTLPQFDILDIPRSYIQDAPRTKIPAQRAAPFHTIRKYALRQRLQVIYQRTYHEVELAAAYRNVIYGQKPDGSFIVREAFCFSPLNYERLRYEEEVKRFKDKRIKWEEARRFAGEFGVIFVPHDHSSHGNPECFNTPDKCPHRAVQDAWCQTRRTAIRSCGSPRCMVANVYFAIA